MSLSTATYTAFMASGKEREALAPTVGKNAEQERKELKLAYPDFIPGKRRRISASVRDDYLFYIAAAKYMEEQKELASNVIRRILGDAEIAYTGSIVIAQRRIVPVDAHMVEAHTRDGIHPVAR